MPAEEEELLLALQDGVEFAELLAPVKWKDGKLVYGKETYSDGNWYEGEFKNWNRHGKGTYQYANGDHYEGGFSEGKFDGEGVFYHANGNVRQGRWEKGSYKG